VAQCCGAVVHAIALLLCFPLPSFLHAGPCGASAFGCSRQAHPAQPVTKGDQGGSSSAAKVMRGLGFRLGYLPYPKLYDDHTPAASRRRQHSCQSLDDGTAAASEVAAWRRCCLVSACYKFVFRHTFGSAYTLLMMMTHSLSAASNFCAFVLHLWVSSHFAALVS